MNQRIEPTHFIEVWSPRDGTGRTSMQVINNRMVNRLYNTHNKLTIALFLIRPKTQQEKEKSIYYPVKEQV